MDAAVPPNFAVSSLCAATASCSAATLGLAWAVTGERLDADDHPDATYVSPSTPRPSTSFRHSNSTRQKSQQRPQSAVIHGHRDASWALSPTSAAPGGPRHSYQSFRTDTPAESLQETDASEAGNEPAPVPSSALPRRSRSTWFRRRLTLTQSSESGPAVVGPPPTSTASVYTNASNKPIVPRSIAPTTSRNRLVKRSTCQNLQTPLSPSLPDVYSTPFRPTFRRPATSHQRSVESHVQSLRHQQSQSSALPSYKPSQESIDSVPQRRQTAWRWEPFFRRQIVRVKAFQETSLKDPSTIFLGKRDELRCVQGPNGNLPTLVMAASVTARVGTSDYEFATPAALKRPATHSYSDPAALSRAARRFSQFREEFSEVASPPSSMSAQNETGRFALPFNAFSLTPTPAPFKVIRRRSARTRDGNPASDQANAQPMGERRSVQQKLPTYEPLDNIDDVNDSEAKAMSNGVPGRRTRASFSGIASDDASEWRTPDAQATHRMTGGRIFRRHSHSSGMDGENGTVDTVAGDSLSAANLSSAGARHVRGSRVVSDQGSAVGAGSDTDNSRVFSVNGEDADAFSSETNYDSLRTGGTNSSGSGRRSMRIESVFVDQGRESGFNSDVLSVLEEKLSVASMSSSGKLGGIEAESVGNVNGGGSYVPSNTSPRQHSIGRRATSIAGDSPDFNISAPSSPIIGFSSTLQLNTARTLFADEDLDLFWDAPESSTEIHIQDADSALASRPLIYETQAPSEGPFETLEAEESHLATTSKQAKIDLWAYSEHNPANVSPYARPQTVHGKSTDRSGQRVVQRRVNHHRSHSEPKIADDMKPYTPEMFQLGKKGVSENWDSDFEDQFEDPLAGMAVVFESVSPPRESGEAAAPSTDTPAPSIPPTPFAASPAAAAAVAAVAAATATTPPSDPAPAPGPTTATAVSSASSSVRRPQSGTLAIPSYISEMQGTVRGQFKAVGELKMLVEELRRLTNHAERLKIESTGHATALRLEAQGIIQLADADEVEESAAWRQPRSRTSVSAHNTAAATTAVVDRHPPHEASSSPQNMAEVVVKNMAAAKPDLAAGDKKPNFDTLALKELVGRASACVAALKAEIAQAEGTARRESAAVHALQEIFRKSSISKK